MDDQQINLRCVLTSSKEGVPLRLLMSDYRQLASCELNLHGYPSLLSYLRSIPEVVRLSNAGGEVICHGVASERSSHIEQLIARQRTAKKKRSGASRGGRGRGRISRGSSAFAPRGARGAASSISSSSGLSSPSASTIRGRGGPVRAPYRGGVVSSRRPLQEQQLYTPPSMRSSLGRGGSGSAGTGFSSRGNNSNGRGGGDSNALLPHPVNGRQSVPAAYQRPAHRSQLSTMPIPSPPSPPLKNRQQPESSVTSGLSKTDYHRVQNLTISTQQHQQQQQQTQSTRPQSTYSSSFSSSVLCSDQLLAAARSLIQPRGSERSYFWRQAAKRSGVAPPAQFDALEASLLAEGVLRVEDILGRLMYYPAASAAVDSPVLSVPTTPKAPSIPTAPTSMAATPTTSSASAAEVDEWGFEVGASGDNLGEAYGDDLFEDDLSETADDGEIEGDDEDDDESDTLLNVADLTVGNQFTSLCFGSDESEDGVWVYTLSSQLEAQLEQVMKEASALVNHLRRELPPLFAQYCMATMPEEILGQPVLLICQEDSNELLRCRLASDVLSEAVVKIQLLDKCCAPMDVPMTRLRRLSVELISELLSKRHGPQWALIGQLASQCLACLTSLPDAAIRFACQNPPPKSLFANGPELMSFQVESTAPELAVRWLK